MSKNKGFARFVPATVLLALMFVSFPALSLSITGEQSSGTPGAEIGPGVVVEKIAPHGEAEKAGLQEGDVLLTWSRGDSKGEIQSPFDIMDVETEQGRLGGVKLEGLRGKERQTWSLGPSSWGLTTRPNFSETLLSSYLQGQELANRGKATETAEATTRWNELAKQYSGATSPWLPAWLLFHNAEFFRDAKQWKEADENYQSAVQSASGVSPVVGAQILQTWANTYQQRNDWPNAEKYLQQSIMMVESSGHGKLLIALDLNTLGRISSQRGDLGKVEQRYNQALEIYERLAPGTILLASNFSNLGVVAGERGDLAKAEQYHRQALEIREKLAPGSLDVAASLNNLGVVAYERGDLAKADQYHRQALEIREKLAPGSLAVAASLLNLGNVSIKRGDLAKAEQYYRQALEIEEKLAPGSLDVATSLGNLGVVANERGDLAKAEQYHRQALEIREKLAPGSLAVASSLLNLGNVAIKRGDLAKAEQNYGQALEIEEKLAPGSLDVAQSLGNLGNVAVGRGDLAKAKQYYSQALEIEEKLAPGSLDMARIRSSLGILTEKRGSLAKEEQYHRQALEIREKLAPGSLDVAASLLNLGNVAKQRGDLAKAEEYHRQALEIREKLAPGSLDVATSLGNLGVVAKQRGDLAKAEQYHRQALEIREKLAPGSLDVAASLGNLGVVAKQRGDLAKAEQYYRQALEIEEKLAPGSLDLAAILGNLGNVAAERGDLAKAEQNYGQALEIEEKLAPGSLDVAQSLGNLGNVAEERGDLAKAEEYHRQALEIREKLAPGSLDVATSLGNLGVVANKRRDLAKAEQYYRQALEIREKLAPGSLDVAQSLGNLGVVAAERGDLAKAEQYYRQAVTIGEKVAPSRIETAEFLAELAAVLRERQQPDVAAQSYERAVSALESQTARLGGSEEVRSGFRANHSAIYRKYADLLLGQNKPARAFEVLEGSRSRILLEMLLAAHVDIRKGADPSLLQQERSLQESLSAKSDRRLRLLGEKAKEKQIATFTQEIEGLEKEYQEIEDRLRLSSPRYAALTQPQPLNANEIQQLLDPDTVLFEYSLGEKRSYVFVVTASTVNVYELPKQADIESAAKSVYGFLSSRNASLQGETRSQTQSRERKAEAGYAEAAEKLSQIVLAPVAKQIQGKRLLIVADGALQYIPFAALPSPDSSVGPKAPLIAEHEIVSLPSASILSVLRREVAARKTGHKAVMVLADPVFDSQDDRLRRSVKAVDVSVNSSQTAHEFALDRSAREVGVARDGIFPRLPFSRREAEAIYSTAQPGDATKALDFDASKATATSSQLGDYRIVHLATHGLVNSEHPELSGLVLSLIDRQGRDEDGFLRLSDIYNLELNAELVVLSACQTALGKQISGEGLIGITRGFMYAGSPRVIASLWKVDDEATAELMKKFYEGVLKNGQTPAEALRAAQIWMLDQPRWKAPYYWAGFILQGEWK